MNTHTIFLSSSTTSTVLTASELVLFDNTTIYLNLSGITEEYIPTYLKIDWGDGEQDTINNSIYKNYRTDSILYEVQFGKYSSLFSEEVKHVYYPSVSGRYKSLSAQVLIEYSNGDYTYFLIPIKIITADYFESVYDIKHIGVNMIPVSSNTKLHTFSIDKGGFMIESYS